MPRKYKKQICKRCGKEFFNQKYRDNCSITCRNIANSNKKTINLAIQKEYLTWACGGGVDSAAIAVLICKKILPTPDCAYMTINGYDSQHTIDYVNNIIRPRLIESVGIDLNIINSENNSLIQNGFVTIPAYTTKDGETIKYRTMCNYKWKVQPAFRWLKKHGIKKCKNLIGISVDERNRVKKSTLKWISYWYPLVEMNISRRDCKQILSDNGWPVPERSACFFCPQKSDNEWLCLKEAHNDEWIKAIEIEREIHKTHPDVYLHKSCKPLEDVEFIGGGWDKIKNV